MTVEINNIHERLFAEPGIRTRCRLITRRTRIRLSYPTQQIYINIKLSENKAVGQNLFKNVGHCDLYVMV